MSKLALQADLWYNKHRNIVMLAGAWNTPLTLLAHLIRRCAVNTVPHSALYDNIPAVPGIYKITCTMNKQFYIGSTVNLRKRWNEHRNGLVRKDHGNQRLQRAWNKYGEDAFVFEIIEFVLPFFLLEREQYWLDKLKPFGKKGFNMTPTAGSTLGRKFSQEAKEKIRLKALGRKRSLSAIEKTRRANTGRKQLPKAIEKIRQAKIGKKRLPESVEKSRQGHLGMKHTIETRQKMSQSHIGRVPGMTGKKHSPESCEKMSQSQLGRKHSPESIEKVRQAHLGKKRTPEQIENMKRARWGKKEE